MLDRRRWCSTSSVSAGGGVPGALVVLGGFEVRADLGVDLLELGGHERSIRLSHATDGILVGTTETLSSLLPERSRASRWPQSRA